MGPSSYVQPSFQLAVASELHKHDLIEKEPYQVKRFRDIRRFIAGVGHSGTVLMYAPKIRF